MPQIGEIRRAENVGHLRAGGEKYIWHACVHCGKTNWQRLVYIKHGKHLRCQQCAGIAKRVQRRYFLGYVQIRLHPNDAFYPMASKRQMVFEHRLIVAKRLGRCLLPSEIVHHINGIKDDNRDENLELISLGNHTLRTKFCNQCEVKKELRLIRWQIKHLEEQVRNLTSSKMGIN